MTNERDYLRERARSLDAADPVVRAPGRTSASAALTPPGAPVASGIVMRKASGAATADAESAVQAAAASTGERLPDDLRGRFESSLGTDLSGVRVHTGGASQSAASTVSARAYAIGNDIHFGAGEFDPASPGGQQLIAHEVAHTVQQRGGTQRPQYKLAVSQPHDTHEVEADRAAAAMVAGAPFALGGAPAAIARDPKDADDKAGASAKPKVEAGDKGITGSVSVSYKTAKIPISKLKCKMQGEVKVKGELGLENTSDAADAKPPSAALIPQAGEALAKEHGDSEAKPESFIEDWEVEFVDKEFKPGKKGKAELGLGATLVLKTRGGGVFKVGITILKLGKKNDPQTVVTDDGFANGPIKVECGVITASESLPLWQIPEGKKWRDFNVKGGLKLDFIFTIEPDIAELALEIAKKFLPRIVGQAAGKVAQTATEVLASWPAVIGLAGAYITVKSTLATLQDASDMKNVAAAAEQAVFGYAGGFSSAVGCKDVAGDPAWHAQGAADGQRLVADQIAKIQAQPQFAQYNFTADELRGALLARCKHEGDGIYDTVYQGSQGRIKEAYVAAWKAHLSSWQKLFTNTKTDEMLLRTRMGIAKGGGQAADMPQGADTGLPPPEKSD